MQRGTPAGGCSSCGDARGIADCNISNRRRKIPDVPAAGIDIRGVVPDAYGDDFPSAVFDEGSGGQSGKKGNCREAFGLRGKGLYCKRNFPIVPDNRPYRLLRKIWVAVPLYGSGRRFPEADKDVYI